MKAETKSDLTIPKVMIDNCIESNNANPARWERIELKPLHGIGFTNKLIVCRGKQLDPKAKRLNLELPYIHAIARAAKENKLLFYSYMELYCEHIMGHQSLTSWGTPFYPFRGISYTYIESPIHRGEFFESFNWAAKEEINKFINWLIELDLSQVDNFKQLKRPLKSDFKRLGEFQKLVSEIGKKSARDIYHFWVAECNDLDYFLTTDFKFLDSYNTAIKKQRIKTNCIAISPSGLANILGVTLDGIELPEEGQLYLMNGSKYYE